MSECISNTNLTHFEICQARTWAMYVLKSNVNTRLILDVTDRHKTSIWFLAHDIPQEHGGVKLGPWYGICKENVIEYMNGDNATDTLHIRAFTVSSFPSSLYISLYNTTTNARFAPMCLIIWDRAHPEVTNQGYAPGRCPDHVVNYN